jgi:hypothetical protein
MSGRRSAPTTLCSQKGTYNQWTLIIVCGTVYIVLQRREPSRLHSSLTGRVTRAWQYPPSLQRMSSGAKACRLRGLVQQTGRHTGPSSSSRQRFRHHPACTAPTGLNSARMAQKTPVSAPQSRPMLNWPCAGSNPRPTPRARCSLIIMSGRRSAPTTLCSQKGTYNQWTLIIVCGTVYIVLQRREPSRLHSSLTGRVTRAWQLGKVKIDTYNTYN